MGEHPNTKSEVWANWVASAAPEITGFRIDALSVPEAPEEPGRFAHDVWAFHLSRKGSEPRTLVCGLKPQVCFLRLIRGKGPKKASRATLPAFLQKIKKEMVGQVITGLGITEGERFIHLKTQTELVWIMIPAAPNAYWKDSSGSVKMTYRRTEKIFETKYIEARASKSAMHGNPWFEEVPRADTPAVPKPAPSPEKRAAKQAAARAQMQGAIDALAAGPDWREWGEAFQNLWNHPDYQSDSARRDLVQTIEECFEDAKKLDRKKLELEKRLGALGTPSPRVAPKAVPKIQTSGVGLTYISAEGREIWVGRSSAENRKLVIQSARGADIWVHVKGRPGAHVIVRAVAGKPPSLETLLDAAVLAVVHSKGMHWGKTEVDYTERKYVKATPGGGEGFDVHFSQNKTLVVDAASEDGQRRLKRLSEARAGD